jgi:DNA-binding beta-propeller fold protein YncE
VLSCIAGVVLGSVIKNKQVPGSVQSPRGVAVDSLGNVFVADTFNHWVQRLSPDGQALAHWGGQGTAAGSFRVRLESRSTTRATRTSLTRTTIASSG